MSSKTMVWFVALACGGCDTATDGVEREAESEEIEVELVGPGVISTELPEFASTLSRGGDTIYFNRTPPDRSALEMFFAVRSGDAWSEARPFEPTAGAAAIDPFLSLDGRRLYFSSNRPRPGVTTESFNLWVIDRTATGWSAPRDLGAPINSDSSDVFNSFSSDGTMVFSSRRNGSRRVYSATLTDGAWSEPVLLNFGGSEVGSNPAISPDGSFMIISARGPDDDLPDLYVTCRSNGEWEAPQRLPEPINSPFREFAPGIAELDLYFTSERPGIVGPQPDSIRPPGDIYRTPLRHAARLCPSGDGVSGNDQ